MKTKLVIHGVSILFIVLFLYTGLSKLFAYKAFSTELKQIEFLNPIANWIIWVIPLAELSSVILLLNKRWRLKGFYSCFILMSLFTAYMLALNQFDYYVPCSCGGVLENIPTSFHIIANLLLTIIAIGAIILQKKASKSTSCDSPRQNSNKPIRKIYLLFSTRSREN